LLKSKDFSIEHLRLEIEQKQKYDRTRPKFLKPGSVTEEYINHNFDENGIVKNKIPFTGPIRKN